MLFKLISFLVVLVIAGGYYKFDQSTGPLPLQKSKFNINKYWGLGDGSNYKADNSIKPFELQINSKEIEGIHAQLNRTLAYTRPLEGIRFEYGFNTLALRKVVNYWRDDYLPRWQERMEFLNSLPQFTTEIQGLNIHFIHAKPDKTKLNGKKVLPILMLHGWPGSVREFYEIIPMLTDPTEYSEYVFEVVAPSLVGYGWSDAAAKPGFNQAEMAIVMRNLMIRLGFSKFLLQGGDWGAVISNQLSTIFPENVIGYHSNMCCLYTARSILKQYIASFFPESFVPKFGYNHHFPLSAKFQVMLSEAGYFYIQATKPDTIGATLVNHPVGLAAYILEKFQLVTGPYKEELDALERVYNIDALLDNLMIYQLSHTATTAARFYAEYMSSEYKALQLDRIPSPVKMGCARFLNDLPPAIDWALKDKFPNLVHSTYFNEGGHFIALEKPVMLYLDFLEFIKALDLK